MRLVEQLDHLPEIEHPLLRQLYDYWRGLFEGQAPPMRRQIDPLDILPVLPHAWIYLKEPESGRYRCDVAGEQIVAVINRPVVGEYLDDLVGESGKPFLRGQYDKVLSLPAIGHVYGHVYPAETRRYGVGERVILPLRDADGQCRFVLGATLYRNIDEPARAPKVDAPSADAPPTRTLTPLSVLFR